MTTGEQAADERDARLEQRQQRLASRIDAIAARIRTTNLDRWLIAAGGMLVLLGIAVVLLGWFGASGTHVVFEQIPYLISGGLLGLALVFTGAFIYFAYWLTMIVRETREVRRHLTTQERQIALQQEQIGDMLAAIHLAVSSGRRPASDDLVAVASGGILHRRDCPALTGRAQLRTVDAAAGLEPCRICSPPAVR